MLCGPCTSRPISGTAALGQRESEGTMQWSYLKFPVRSVQTHFLGKDNSCKVLSISRVRCSRYLG